MCGKGRSRLELRLEERRLFKCSVDGEGRMGTL